MTRAENGSITPLIAVAMGCCALLMVAIGNVGEQMVNEQRARITADAAALAGIYGGEEAAARLAQHNGGSIVEVMDAHDDDVLFGVVVTVGRHRATAWAVDTWAPPTSTLEP